MFNSIAVFTVADPFSVKIRSYILLYDVITLYLCFNAFDSATFVNGTI